MALPKRTSNPLCHVQIDPATPQDIFLVPLNADAKDILNAHFADYGAYTTVALSQEDAGRGGYGQTGEKYKALKLDSSA